MDGFYSANPKEDPTAQRFDLVEAITPEIEAMAGDAISGVSKGGMKTKLMAAKIAVAGGCAMAIMEGSVLRPLQALAGGAQPDLVRGAGRPAGGAQALDQRDEAARRGAGGCGRGGGAAGGQSRCCLPGVAAVTGSFGRGDPVAILGPSGEVLGKGLVRYTAVEAKAIAGHRSGEIEAILGYAGPGGADPPRRHGGVRATANSVRLELGPIAYRRTPGYL